MTPSAREPAELVPDPSARAVLDHEAARIIRPIDDFQVSDVDMSVVNHAVYQLLDGLMRARGFRIESES